MNVLKDFVDNYRAIRAALPWLDCYVSELPVPFAEASTQAPTEAVKLTASGNIRLVIQTEHSFEEIAEMAKNEPDVKFIIASGTQKLLYHFAAIENLLLNYENIYLANGNFCSMLGLERLVKAGVGKKLLYGSMVPYLDPGQALGPIVLGQFDWVTKCGIAGNNFRKLLGLPPVNVPEVPLKKFPPFMVDAHAHTIRPETTCRFPAPGAAPQWDLWEPVLDAYATEFYFATPSETNRDGQETPASQEMAQIVKDSNGRVRYFTGFDPRHADFCYAEAERTLGNPECVGLKIHPPAHRTYGSDLVYARAFEVAGRFNKTVMTHSWGLSDYNDTQKYSTPLLFDEHCRNYPDTKFVLGHAGGRPNGFPEAVEMCKRHKNVFVDLAGDFFHNGVIQAAAKEIGADKILFASDLYWIDPRCTLGMLIEAELPLEDLWKILRTNALKVYLNR
ncbi:MAG: amidohydrolase family protein [Lentisphaeria bacterium]|nr:amidohydrolase family protein [Lentisphaeria bacterium]